MSAELRDMIQFHLTGRGEAGAGRDSAGQIPALLAPYRNLAAIRHDFPVVLLASPDSEASIDTLTGIVNRLLREIAPEGNAGLMLRQHVLRLEARMRELAGDRRETSLAELWDAAARSVLADCAESERELVGNSISSARFALRADGVVADCDEHLPVRLLRHAWSRAEARRTAESAARIRHLIVRLRDMLRVDEAKGGGSRTPQRLRMKLGKSYRDAFDFERMAEVLEGSTPHNSLPDARRERIRSALAVLESQGFFDTSGVGGKCRESERHGFLFGSLSSALKAWNDRLSAMAELVKAIEIAELECQNAFRDERHAAYFERFGAQALGADDIAAFPGYLVCVKEGECNTRDTARLMEIVSSDLPMKVLVQVDQPLGEPSPVDGRLHSGSYVQQLVQTFIAGNAFILQAPASNLYRQRDALRRGLEFAGPAIFSVYAPEDEPDAGLPAYLVAAAALDSRVFPAFSYDPTAGEGLAGRFDITGNPEVGENWPARTLSFEDENLQSITEPSRFTLADFAVMDPLFAAHFAPVSRESWGDSMVTVADYLDLGPGESLDRVPYVPVVDENNRLRRLVVDEHLLRLVRRCRERWHALQELGGVHNSYAEAQRRLDEEALSARGAAPASAPGPSTPLESAPAEEPPARTDAPPAATAATESAEPWIETPRCTTCDECTKRNDRMFAYDENRQAYIRDPDAGSYRELVEAAENCQVAIIHPGQPRNPKEPGLAELVERAAAFN